jgi:hypothetical protein
MKLRNFRLTIIAGLMMVAVAAWGGNNDNPGHRGKMIGTPKGIGSTLTAAQLDAVNGFLELTGKAKCDVTMGQINYRTPGVQPGEMTNASAAVLIPGGPDCPGPFPLIAFSRGTKLEKAYTNAQIPIMRIPCS